MPFPPHAPAAVVLSVVVGLVVAQVALLVTTVYLHRGITHRALAAHPVLAFACRTSIWLTTGMRPREWAAVHRRHHAATDAPGDPHSPAQHGFWRVLLANAALYRRVARDGVTVGKYARDLPPDGFDRALFDRAFLGLGLGTGLLCVGFGLVFGPWGVVLGLVAATVHAVAYLGLSGAVNAIGHTLGRRPSPNSATNGWLLALLTWGEGLHNNHHDRPTAARFSRRSWPFDHAWWTIRLLRRVGLVELREPRATRPGPIPAPALAAPAADRRPARTPRARWW